MLLGDTNPFGEEGHDLQDGERVHIDRFVPQGAREPLVGLLAQLRLDSVPAQARGQVEDLLHFLHLGRVDVRIANAEVEPLLPLEQGQLVIAPSAVDVVVTKGVVEVAPLDRVLGIGSEEASASSVVPIANSVASRARSLASNRIPRMYSELSSASSGIRTVAPGALGTSLMSFMANSRSCSRLDPALTTISRSADNGVSSALAISLPSRGW